MEDAAFFVVAWLPVFLAPYTKVEESFNLHATHDLLMYGVLSLENYDHFVFPGVVPRSFIGSLMLAYLCYPAIAVAKGFTLITSKFSLQIILRLVLASLNAWGLSLVRQAVSSRFGLQAGRTFTLITCSQFHLPFWMSRTLPNMFALFPVNIAWALIIQGPAQFYTAIGIVTFAAIVLRAELALLLAPLIVQALLSRQTTLRKLLQVGVLWGIPSLSLTIGVDSYFWQQFPIWPEFSGIYFNVFQGKSAEWGVSPPLSYFTLHLPKMLMGAAPLCLIGLIINHQIRHLLRPPIIFVALISFLAHKEWRFVIYVVPIANVSAAIGACWLIKHRRPGWLRWVGTLAFAALLAVNMVLTGYLSFISSFNYPGGEAMWSLHQKVDIPQAHIHIDNLAAQTGASLFLHLNSPPYTFVGSSGLDWVYNKTEGAIDIDRFTHLITERRGLGVILAEIEALDRISPGLPPSLVLSKRLQVVRIVSHGGP